MSRNGSGVYSLPAGNPVVAGTTISSSWANSTLSDIATALTGSLAADGQTPVTGNLQMGGYKLTGLGAGSASTDSITYGQVTGGTVPASFSSLTVSGALTLSGGTANGVLYLNGSKVATSGTAFVFDGTNVGIGTSSPTQKLDVAGSGATRLVVRDTASTGIARLIASGADAYVGNASATGTLYFQTNSSNVMQLDSLGNLGLGTTPNTWVSSQRAFQNGSLAISSDGSVGDVANNRYVNSSGASTYIGNGYATLYRQTTGQHLWYLAGSGTSGGAISFTQAMTLDASGNLGIGVSPSYKLDVAGTARIWNGSDNGRILMTGYYAGFTDPLAQIAFYNDSSTLADKNTSYIKGLVGSNNNNGTLTFWTAGGSNATERMRIDSSGNVGIGTSSPSQLLSIASSAAAKINIKGYSAATGIFVGMDSATDAQIWNSQNGFMRFATNDTERMRIDSSGNVMVGTTTALISASNRGNITVNGTTSSVVALGVNGSTAGYLYADSGSTNLSTGSNAKPLIFETNGSEKMRIDGTGNALFAQAVRATITTDNDLSFDMNAASNFKCTPSAGGALTFTNITSGQTGNIILVNGSNYAITAAATTKVSSTCLATISATGTYWLSYYSDGTNVYVANTGALA